MDYLPATRTHPTVWVPETRSCGASSPRNVIETEDRRHGGTIIGTAWVTVAGECFPVATGNPPYGRVRVVLVGLWRGGPARVRCAPDLQQAARRLGSTGGAGAGGIAGLWGRLRSLRLPGDRGDRTRRAEGGCRLSAASATTTADRRPRTTLPWGERCGLAAGAPCRHRLKSDPL